MKNALAYANYGQKNMSKLANLASIKTARPDHFAYTPHDAAYGAGRILVKPLLGYTVKPPATVSMGVLGAVLRGLRRAAPSSRILIVESMANDKNAIEVFEYHGISSIVDDEMRAADMTHLLTRDYANHLPNPIFSTLTAPEYLDEFDCVIGVAPFKKTVVQGQPLISASLTSLIGFFPNALQEQLRQMPLAAALTEIYFTIGQYINGAVVDLTAKYVSPDAREDRSRNVAVPVGQVVWGDDLLAVDEAACRIAGEPVPDYMKTIQALRKTIS